MVPNFLLEEGKVFKTKNKKAEQSPLSSSSPDEKKGAILEETEEIQKWLDTNDFLTSQDEDIESPVERRRKCSTEIGSLVAYPWFVSEKLAKEEALSIFSKSSTDFIVCPSKEKEFAFWLCTNIVRTTKVFEITFDPELCAYYFSDDQFSQYPTLPLLVLNNNRFATFQTSSQGNFGAKQDSNEDKDDTKIALSNKPTSPLTAHTSNAFFDLAHIHTKKTNQFFTWRTKTGVITEAIQRKWAGTLLSLPIDTDLPRFCANVQIILKGILKIKIKTVQFLTKKYIKGRVMCPFQKEDNKTSANKRVLEIMQCLTTIFEDGQDRKMRLRCAQLGVKLACY